MNKAKVILFAAIALTACAGMADFMYWQVSDAVFDTPAGGDANFAYATVRTGGGEATDTIGNESEYYKLYTVDADGHAHESQYYQFLADPNDSNSTVGDASFFGTFAVTVTVSKLSFSLTARAIRPSAIFLASFALISVVLTLPLFRRAVTSPLSIAFLWLEVLPSFLYFAMIILPPCGTPGHALTGLLAGCC